MATVIEGFKFKRGHRSSKYETWLDGQKWALDPSDVAPATLRSAQAYLTLVARRRGKRITTEVSDGKLVVQAVSL